MKITKIETREQLIQILDTLPDTVALDIETTSLDPINGEIISIIFGDTDHVVYCPGHFLNSLLQLKSKTLILQNFKFDYKFLYHKGLDLSDCKTYDIMLMHHLIDENAEHNLDYQVFSYNKDNYKQVFWNKYKSVEEAPESELIEYACKDVYYTYLLYNVYTKRLHSVPELVEHVHSLALGLYKTELEGVNLDLPYIDKVGPTVLAEIDAAEKALRPAVEPECLTWELNTWKDELAKRKTEKGKSAVKKPVFNFGSSTQLKWLLFEELKLPVLKKTKTKQPSTDFDALELIKEEHPVVGIIQEFRHKSNIYNTFVKGILDRQVDGKIYPEFNINGTTTGRISSSNPNLQNQPKDGPYRGFFIPTPGHVFVGADHSQLEVVVEANLTGDLNLKKVILENISKHDITNEGLGLNDRNLAKTLNFALQYGCGIGKVAKILDCSKADAQIAYNRYWEVYGGVKSLKEKVNKMIDAGVPIVSPFGRSRHLGPSQIYKNIYDLERARRQGYNALIQGTGADITHKAFYELNQIFRERGYGRMLWPIHDEILGECKPEYVEECLRLIKQYMEAVTQYLGWELPLVANTYGPLTRWSKT